MAIANDEYFHNGILGFCMAPYVLYLLSLDYIVFVRPNDYIWRKLMAPMMLENRANFVQLNRGRFREPSSISEWFRQPLYSAVNTLLWAHGLWTATDATFMTETLSNLPAVTVQIRVRAYLIAVIFEKLEILSKIVGGNIIRTAYHNIRFIEFF